MSDDVRTLRVAALQVPSRNGDLEGNLARAVPRVVEAAGRGARLVLLPELLAAGYLLSPRIWEFAEPASGTTARWLAEQAKRSGVWLGSSFLEVVGNDFYNTFVLVGPDGREAGRVRKQTPAVYEAFFMRGDSGPHRIDTPLGRIGVGICYENQLGYLPQLCAAGAVDLLLMPHSAPSPQRSSRYLSRQVDVYEDSLRTIAGWYAVHLGIPVVMANKCGPWTSPIPLAPFVRQRSSFPGLSAIADSDGRVIAQLGGEAATLVEDVTIDPARRRTPPPASGHWARAVPRSTEWLRVVEAVGRLGYRMRARRRARAGAQLRERLAGGLDHGVAGSGAEWSRRAGRPGRRGPGWRGPENDG